MNKEYKIKLDLNKKLYNKKMAFNQFDENVNDFYIEVTKNNEVVKDLDKSIITLVAIKPNNAVDAQFIEVKEGQVYANLKPSMCDLVGNYQAKAMIVLEGEIVTTDTINYSVNEDKIISKLNEDVVSDERFTLFTDALARLSTIEISEEQRVINEAERILSEENRKIEEAKRVEAELIRQHEEADRAKYDATRESNENIRKQNEIIRLSNETNRIDEEAKRVEEENKRKLAEEERNANYNFMTEDEERRRLEANAHKEAENLRVQAETNRVNEEAKRRTSEQARVSAENTRVSNENTRKANEVARKNNETQRIEAETQRQNRYNSFIADAEINANNFENYTNSAKIKEEERKSNELDRKSQEDRRVSNEVERISNENIRKANEVAREENEISRQDIFEDKVDEVDEKIVELNTTKDNFVSSINTKVDTKISEIEVAKSDMTTTVSNKVSEVETRFNTLTSSQQQDAEVIDARDGETSLKARLDRDIEKAKQVYVELEGNPISTESSTGAIQDIEVLGNTVQDPNNLADIKSVGELQEDGTYKMSILSTNGLDKGKQSYQENKCDISLPCQLEKVGDVSDRLYYDDVEKAWCIDKNIARISLDSTLPWIGYKKETNLYSAHLNLQNVKGFETFQHDTYDIMLSNLKFKHHATGIWGTTEEIITNYDEKYIMIFLDNVDTFDKWKQKLNDYNTVAYLIRRTSQKIVLPLSTQITLNSFFGTTHVYMESGEVEGTIKCKIPKSLGATVQSLNYKTDILSDRIEAIEGLKDSQNMKYETDKGYLVCKETKNGVIDDLKLDGKTLVNLAPKYSIKWTHSGTWLTTLLIGRNNANNAYPRVLQDLKPNTEYTVVVNIKTNTQSGDIDLNNYQNNTCVFNDYMFIKPSDIGIKTFKVKTVESFDNINPSDMVILRSQSWSIASGETLIEDIMILEGDHTQNPPSYFEGLKSVGDGVDEVSVESVKGDGNLVEYIELNGVIITNGKDYTDNKYVRTNYITVEPNQTYYIKLPTNVLYNNYAVYFYDSNKSFLGHRRGLTSEFTTITNTKFIRIDMKKADNTGNTQEDINNCDFVVSKCRVSEYIPHQSDKKRLLYYNEETQAWEKPILRQWDSIEKHADGKYYYHQRSGEVVLNGAEKWNIVKTNANHSIFTFRISNALKKPDYCAITNRFVQVSNTSENLSREGEFFLTDIAGGVNISIANSKLSQTNANGFKQWLQANNVTVVYQLAQEKVYECTNIDLITYANETNYVVECGVLSPKTTLKVHSNISNVVRLLQKKVSLLESNVKASQEVQDMMILETDMRTLDIELALMEFIPMTLNLGGSNMLRSATYFNFLKNHIINETYEKEYLENVMNKYLATGRINQDEYNELYKMLYPPVYDIELPIEY